ncbi:MAG: lipoprotein-releasing ABC transporter permease subunit [Deltaproteobacteria bacterium]|nr:lipoprotein-releasing ABC transporter permease subunit [Deltaproteobacteria bacterium]MBI4794626.1 lipoprotein-releasing ABC transporter permease subunit [Deltaproteobacteria bacterium]
MGFFETFVALRYLRGVKKQKGFISLSTLISTAGVAVGVMALIVVIGVMTGFDQDLKKKILSVNAHVIVLQQGASLTDYRQVAAQVKTVPGVVDDFPFIYTQVMLSAPGNISGGVIRGLDLETLRKGGPRGLEVQRGNFKELAETAAGEPPRIAIGNELARNLNLSLGEYLNIISPLGTLTPMGRMPRMKPFRVSAIFHSGMYEFDNTLVYTSIPSLQEFLGLGDRVTGLEVEVKNIYAADQIAAAIQQKLGPRFTTKDWMQMNRSLFSALKLEKIAMFIILTLIILVAAFGIASTLFMMVMKKTKDIAILKSMGATRQSIMQIFILKGLVIGLIGTSIGVGLGLFLCALLKRYEFIKLPRDVYYIATLPVQVESLDLVLIIGAAMFISFVATLYPSWQAARLDPVEAIRYE